MNRTWRTVALFAAIPVILLLAGVGTYFLGGAEEDSSQTQPAVAESVEQTDSQVDKVRLFRLGWGSGPDQVARTKGDDPASTFEAVAPAPDGLLIVDHPPSHIGARVRWVDYNGTVARTEWTPSGSTLFKASSQDLLYVLAKQAGPSETLVRRVGSEETTFVVPLQINSGGIVELDDTVYVNTQSGTSDVDTQMVSSLDRLVPVVLNGAQQSDDAASRGARDGTLVGYDGEIYQFAQSIQGFGAAESITSTVKRLSDGSTVRVPDRARLLGVDRWGRLWLTQPGPDLDARARFLTAWPGYHSEFRQVLVAKMDGTVDARVVVPYSEVLDAARESLSLGPDGLYAATADPTGVTFWRYEVER